MSCLLQEHVQKLMHSRVEKGSVGNLEGRDTRQGELIGSDVLTAIGYCSSNEEEGDGDHTWVPNRAKALSEVHTQP